MQEQVESEGQAARREQYRGAALRYHSSAAQRTQRAEALAKIEEPGMWRHVEDTARIVQRAALAGVEGVRNYLETYDRPPGWPPIVPFDLPPEDLPPEDLPPDDLPPVGAVLPFYGGILPQEDVHPPREVVGPANDLISSYYLVRGAEARRTVARIVNPLGAPLGSGFLVGPGLLMTNAHVLPLEWVAKDCAAEFDFVCAGPNQELMPCSHKLQPEIFFHANRDLDYALVAVAEASPEGDLLTARGWSEMIGPSGKALVSERVNIIQHPQGRPQELALRDNRIVDLVDAFVHYRADTQTGSSGSPVWSDSWDLVALHHASIGPLNEDEEIVTRDGSVWDFVDESDVDWEANEGVRISRIVEDLKIVSASWQPERSERIQACLGTPEFAERRVPGPFSPREPDAPPLPPPLSDPREEIPAEGLGALATWSDFDRRCSAR